MPGSTVILPRFRRMPSHFLFLAFLLLCVTCTPVQIGALRAGSGQIWKGDLCRALLVLNILMLQRHVSGAAVPSSIPAAFSILLAPPSGLC